MILESEGVTAAEISPNEFKQLRRECLPVQSRVIPRRMREEKEQLKRLAKAEKDKRKAINEERKKEKADKRFREKSKFIKGKEDIFDKRCNL